ncbi:MAG: hypothetical protein N3D09_05025 [Archaeoglobaceae archaeon]|nr:hypothetical protein [Archaeoglobaceae archaeon]
MVGRESVKNGMMMMVFIFLVVVGCILLPTLAVLRMLMGSSWELFALLTLMFLFLSITLGKSMEKEKRIEKIRSAIQSRSWMSLADYGASFGKIEKRSSKKKRAPEHEEEKWLYLKKVLEKPDSKIKKL